VNIHSVFTSMKGHQLGSFSSLIVDYPDSALEAAFLTDHVKVTPTLKNQVRRVKLGPTVHTFFQVFEMVSDGYGFKAQFQSLL